MEETLLPTEVTADNLERIQEILQHLVRLTQDETERSNLDPRNFQNLNKILKVLMAENVVRYAVFAEGFRFLRNAVVACKRNQEAVREESVLYETTNAFLRMHHQYEGDYQSLSNSDMLTSIRCALQFLSNSMVDNLENVSLVSSLFLTTLYPLLERFSCDEKVISYAAMILHLGVKQQQRHFEFDSKLMEILTDNLHLEFVVYAVESMILHGNLADAYDDLDPKRRLRLLNFLIQRSDLHSNLDNALVSKFKKSFIERSDFILTSKVEDGDNVFCWEIAVLLEVLCYMSMTCGEVLQPTSVLLTTVIFLLKQIHELGKSTEVGAFSVVEDLHKLTSKSSVESDADDIRAHPAFQFKAHLIRLIANLVHRNKLNQDKVRELECLPIILDNCKIDARNPFIAQWSVLAIRNLCEGNMENQTYIQEVQRVDTEKLLPKIEMVNLE